MHNKKFSYTVYALYILALVAMVKGIHALFMRMDTAFAYLFATGMVLMLIALTLENRAEAKARRRTERGLNARPPRR
jgi:cation transport ATPase